MSRILWIIFLSSLCLSMSAAGNDLYKIVVSDQADAEALMALGVEPILVVTDGYLVLADASQAAQLKAGALKFEFIASDLTKESLALDNRRDDKNVGRYPLVYDRDGLRLFRVDGSKSLAGEDGSALIPIRNENLVIRYKVPLILNRAAVFQADDLLGLIDHVSQDSVWAYLHHLEAFDGRLAGTQSNYSARDWLRTTLQSYGYTNVTYQSFWAYVNGSYKQCYNVVARKQGSVYPNRQIVVGAHFDAVEGSPGADDNGTGTVGVLEIARALAGMQTDYSFVFVLFDSEEQGLNGSWNYSDIAAGSGDSIICMINMDMIGHYMNHNYADLHYGAETAYADLWAVLADSLVNITAYFGGLTSNSDHYPFVQNGYDVLYAAEHEFSNVYHTPRDSTTYVNFDYCTRIIKAMLASAYTINVSPLPVRMTSLRDGGDGQSLRADWAAADPGAIDHYGVYYRAEPDGPLDSLITSPGETGVLITGLANGQEYRVYVLGFNSSGYSSLVHDEKLGTPHILPAIPQDYSALPLYHAVSLNWKGDNTELDFSHYAVIRDAELLPYAITDTFFVDDDFILGGDFHDYSVVAVDQDGNMSDTTGILPVSMRAATLEPGRVLAVNRSNRASPYLVAETVTGEFMRDALDGYDYDYLSDTASASGDDTNSVNLVDMLDYEVIILGGESARTDDFANNPFFGGILDTIGYYLSIGGKVIIFGRFGNITSSSDIADTLFFGSTGFDRGYRSWFHMDRRVQYLSQLTPTVINSDLVGAHSQAAGYPDLVWDSVAAVNHSAPWPEVSGIPCPSFGILTGAQSEVIYTYDSRNNFPLTEGKPVAWRYNGDDWQYVFFEIPLSFMERNPAKTALQTALSGMLSSGPEALSLIVPDTLDVSADPLPDVAVYLGDFAEGKTAGDVDQSSILINGQVAPQSVSILTSYPGFTGEVLEIDIPAADLIGTYGAIIDTVGKVYTVLWKNTGDPQSRIVYDQLTLIGSQFLPGDANGDWVVNVADAVYLINFVFKDGPAPEPQLAGDANCDAAANIGDAVYLINYVFKGGPPPGCN